MNEITKLVKVEVKATNDTMDERIAHNVSKTSIEMKTAVEDNINKDNIDVA